MHPAAYYMQIFCKRFAQISNEFFVNLLAARVVDISTTQDAQNI